MRRARPALLASTTLLAAALLAVGNPPSAPSATDAEKQARLGIFYFGGWSGTLANFHFTGLLSSPYTGRQPLYGWLDNTTQTMRTQLYWANRMGADFFNFLWYYRPERVPGDDPYLNRALGNYLALKDHQGVGFAITYTNHTTFAIPRAEWRAVAEAWVTRYFSHPDYVRIAGKPVLFVHDSTGLWEQLGRSDANVNSALAELRTAARAHGLPGVVVVGGHYVEARSDWEYYPEPYAGQEWDAITQYGYPALPGFADGERPYRDVVSAARAMWDRFGARSVQPYIPVVMAGWDPRPWKEDVDGHLFWYTRSPEEVGGLVRDAVDWVARNPRMLLDGGPPLVMLTAWNELGEGMYVLPTKQDGFAYGQAIASAIGLQWNPQKRALSIAVRGNGSVRVQGSRCSPSCSRRFDEGLVASLRARPAPGYRFRGWSGACSGRKVTCTILMDRTRSAVARFVR